MVLFKSSQSFGSKNSNNSIECSPYRHRAKLSQRLDEIIEANPGYRIMQQNGQRIFEPSSVIFLDPPSKGCEIFIGNIPKYIYEDILIPLFQNVGQIYNFRLMLDFSERNRGYAFATYFCTHHAKMAIEKYNGYVLGNGTALAVFKSIDNRRLFVGNIPRDKCRDDVLYLFDNYVDGLVDIIMYSSWQIPTLNRGFAFLEFESHSSASVARRQLHPRNLVVWNHALYVDWADPVPDVDPLVMAKVTVLYVKNLPLEVSNDEVYTMIQNIVGPCLIRKTHKMLTYAFVHCYDRTSAEIVMKNLADLTVNDNTVEVEWARPKQYSAQYRSTLPPDNYCLNPNITAVLPHQNINYWCRSLSTAIQYG